MSRQPYLETFDPDDETDYDAEMEGFDCPATRDSDGRILCPKAGSEDCDQLYPWST